MHARHLSSVQKLIPEDYIDTSDITDFMPRKSRRVCKSIHDDYTMLVENEFDTYLDMIDDVENVY